MVLVAVIMATPTLHYFDGFGRGEVIRLLFIHSKTAFTDHRFAFEEWKEAKAAHFSEFNQLPMLNIDGLNLVQSLAALRYAAAKLGYLPADPALQYQIDSLIFLREDFLNAVFPVVFSKNPEAVDKWYEDNAPKFLGFLETRLSHNHDGNGWFVGDSVTLVDIVIFEWIWDHFTRAARSKYAHFLDAAPKLKAFIDRLLAASDELRAYHAAREDKSF